MAMDQAELRKLGDKTAIANELVKQFTKHIEDTADDHDESVVKLKLVVLGPMGAGKTCWLSRLIHDKFNQAQTPTIGAKFSSQGVAIEDYVYNFEIWDVSGEAWCKTLVPMYLQYAQAAVICYDASKRSSFEEAKEWVTYVKKLGERDLFISLVGMKSDLGEDMPLAVEREVAEAFFVKEQKQDESFLFPHVSAKTGENVQDVILQIAETFHESGQLPGRDGVRPSIMSPDEAYGPLFDRANQNQDVLQKNVEGDDRWAAFQERLKEFGEQTRIFCTSCFHSSRQVGMATYESAKVNGKSLARKSRKFGREITKRAAKLIRPAATEDVEVSPKDAEETPTFEKLKG